MKKTTPKTRPPRIADAILELAAQLGRIADALERAPSAPERSREAGKGRRCSPHRWTVPKVGDTEIACESCGTVREIARLQSRMVEAMTEAREKTVPGDTEFGPALIAAWEAARQAKAPDPAGSVD
ncbi:MAG: hypothetical protein F4Y03_17980, partial [Alphaproteobacteria bacterium]|nr:hypothetical protein [Alphaproteobacteria bacterium]